MICGSWRVVTAQPFTRWMIPTTNKLAAPEGERPPCRRRAEGMPLASSASYGHTQHTDLHPPPTRRHTHTEEQGLSLNREPFLKRGISLNQGFLEIDLKRKKSFFLEKSILISKILLRKKLNVLTSYSYSALLLSYSLTSLHLTSSHLTSSHLTIPCALTLTLT